MFQSLLSYFAAGCGSQTFFGLPSWYTYLERAGRISYNSVSKTCEFNLNLTSGGKLDLTSLTLIGFGILDILLRLGALVTVGFVMYGGVQYVLSRGEPDKAKRAAGTIVNALIGLAITVIAAAAVRFIGNRIG